MNVPLNESDTEPDGRDSRASSPAGMALDFPAAANKAARSDNMPLHFASSPTSSTAQPCNRASESAPEGVLGS
jgi:hypothetical protein